MNNKVVTVLFVVFLSVSASFWTLGGQLIVPAMLTIRQPPTKVQYETVSFEQVLGWYFSASSMDICVLLLHGIRSNRLEMLGRALFFQSNDYPSLAIDLQAHGESPGKAITFGYRESESARNAVTFLRESKGCKRVVALGSSLGGAAAVLGAKPLNVDGYILEAVYPSIEMAVRNRMQMRLGKNGKYFSFLLYQQIPYRLGIESAELQPAEAIKRVKAPVLIMNGTEDRRTTKEDALALYENAPDPKMLVWFDGANHINLYEYDGTKYGKTVLEFLKMVVDSNGE